MNHLWWEYRCCSISPFQRVKADIALGGPEKGCLCKSVEFSAEHECNPSHTMHCKLLSVQVNRVSWEYGNCVCFNTMAVFATRSSLTPIKHSSAQNSWGNWWLPPNVKNRYWNDSRIITCIWKCRFKELRIFCGGLDTPYWNWKREQVTFWNLLDGQNSQFFVVRVLDLGEMCRFKYILIHKPLEFKLGAFCSTWLPLQSSGGWVQD